MRIPASTDSLRTELIRPCALMYALLRIDLINGIYVQLRIDQDCRIYAQLRIDPTVVPH